MPERRPPSPEALVGWVLAATAVALLWVGAATGHTEPVRPCRTIEGLVLDGGRVTTTAPIRARRPVERIPRRELGDPTTTTTENDCG